MLKEEDFKKIGPGTKLSIEVGGQRVTLEATGVPFFNYDCDDPGWEVETDGGFVSIENEMDIVLTAREIAKDLEQFAYERGEYDFEGDDRPSFIAPDIKISESEISIDQEGTLANIEKLVTDDPERLINWLDDNISELYDVEEINKAEALQRKVQTYMKLHQKDKSLDVIEEAYMTVSRDTFADIMSGHLMDEGISTYKMAEELIYNYLNCDRFNTETEKAAFRKGIDTAMEILTYQNLKSIALEGLNAEKEKNEIELEER